jgi:hypothetical protein
MMNFSQIDSKISANGYRRKASSRKVYNDETGAITTIYDYEHRKKLDMFSVYVNEYGSVDSIEFTAIEFNRETRKYTQKVSTVTSLAEFNKLIK